MRVVAQAVGLIIGIILGLGTRTLTQTIYQATGSATVKPVAVSNVSVVTGTVDAYLIVVPNALLAAPDVTAGQSAFDGCMAVTNSGPICEGKRGEAITGDIAARVKTLLQSVPDATFTSLNLKRVE